MLGRQKLRSSSPGRRNKEEMLRTWYLGGPRFEFGLGYRRDWSFSVVLFLCYSIMLRLLPSPCFPIYYLLVTLSHLHSLKKNHMCRMAREGERGERNCWQLSNLTVSMAWECGRGKYVVPLFDFVFPANGCAPAFKSRDFSRQTFRWISGIRYGMWWCCQHKRKTIPSFINFY